ncbi:hypothetical protein [Niabella soli]|uniref:Uncharacterized protein n=1 Tax=Niabella soli DSM 19437 TaxID=929713 RepID=W0F6Q5_9BACT|nr:hypothetical protein [Niabella soli]AHF17139.1 hypothetical protein NIASO_02375 [Niabella soli DSM 19437]
MATYTVKPLEWEHIDNAYWNCSALDTVFVITPEGDRFNLAFYLQLNTPGSSAEGIFPTLTAAQEKADQLWEKHLQKYLEAVK